MRTGGAAMHGVEDARESRELHALRGLHDLITAIHSGSDLEQVLQRAAQGVVEVLGFQVAVIDCLDSYGYVEAMAVAGDDDACRTLKGRRVRLDDLQDEFDIAEDWGLLKFVPHDRLPPGAEYTWAPDFVPLDGDDAWDPMDALYALLQGPTGNMVGMLSVDMPDDGRRPNALTRQVLEMYAVQAGLAIHHAQERERLRERVRLAAATRTIVDNASQETDLARVIDASFAPLVEGFRADLVVIRVFDAEVASIHGERLDREGATYPAELFSHLFELIAGEGGELVRQTSRQLLELGQRAATSLWPRGRTAQVGGLGDSSEGLVGDLERDMVAAMLARHGVGSMLLIPLGAGPECLGYIALMRRGALDWSAAEDEAALEVGREIGRVVHRTRLYDRERQLVGELQELDRYRAEMIGTITHELRNPLTSIGGHVEMLADEGVAPLSVDAIGRNVRRLQRLVDDLLILSNLRDSQRPLNPVSLELSGLASDACDLLDIQASRRGLILDTEGIEPGVLVIGEREQILRLLMNIVGNAIKYTPDGGSVRLAVRNAEGYAELTCTDTGIGIAPGDLETLFDEFDRGSHPAAHAVPGTGLGLAIVRRIVDQHGGSIQVESVLGEGSTFRVRLPAPSGPDEAS